MNRSRVLLSLSISIAAAVAGAALLVPAKSAPAAAAPPRSADHMVAFGAFVDHPTSAQSIEQGITIGDALADRYAVSGPSAAARRAQAARLAAADVAAITFDEAEVRAKAASLGADLDTCADLCAETRRWIVAELRKDAVVAIARGARPTGQSSY